MPLMSHYIAKVGLTDMCHIVHGAAVSLRTATDIAARIDTLKDNIDLSQEINTFITIETTLNDIYTTIAHKAENYHE